jgi:pimeloyl-ACP methyl ester carboxylesterase
VLDFIQALDLGNVTVVGHSMGGAITLAIGLRNPPQVNGLILLGSGARLRVSDAILTTVLSDYESAVNVLSDLRWSDNASAELIQLGYDLMRQADPAVVHSDYTACDKFDMMEQLEQITLPTLVVSGTNDVLTPAKYSRFLADNIPQSRLVLIEGAGHMLALEQPDMVASEVTRFLDGLNDGQTSVSE